MVEINRRAALSTLSALAATGLIADAKAADVAMPPSKAKPNPPIVISKLRKDYADGPYGQIHYRNVKPAASKNLPLLCFHLMPISSVVYDNFLLEIGTDRWALAADMPGYGGSAPPPQPQLENGGHGRPTVTIADYAKAMIQLLDKLGIQKVDLMGYHTGSSVATEVARTIPDRVRRVVMISAAVFNAQEVAAYEKWFEPTPIFKDFLREKLSDNGAMRYNFRDIPNERRYAQWMMEWLRGYPREHWGHAAVFSYGADMPKYLEELRQPVLLLNPLGDDIPQITRRAGGLLKNPQSKYVELPGWTHGALDGRTVALGKMVRDFLDQA